MPNAARAGDSNSDVNESAGNDASYPVRDHLVRREDSIPIAVPIDGAAITGGEPSADASEVQGDETNAFPGMARGAADANYDAPVSASMTPVFDPALEKEFSVKTGVASKEITERYLEMALGDVDQAVSLFREMWEPVPGYPQHRNADV